MKKTWKARALPAALYAMSAAALAACSGADEPSADKDVEEYCATAEAGDALCSANEAASEADVKLGASKQALTAIRAIDARALTSVRAIAARPVLTAPSLQVRAVRAQ